MLYNLVNKDFYYLQHITFLQ